MYKTEVLCIGTFNIVHSGHIDLFEFAAEYANNKRIDVALYGDMENKKKYGDKAIPLLKRARVLKAVCYVDAVHIIRKHDASRLIRKLEPRYLVVSVNARLTTGEQLAVKDLGVKLIVQQAEISCVTNELSQYVDDDLLVGPKRVVDLKSVIKPLGDFDSCGF